MGTNSSIEWTTHTFNPWSGCVKVSPACANCYAANLPPGMRRHAVWGADTPRIPASESYWRQPIAWDRAAAKAGERHRVFCASTADVFEARADLDPARLRLFKLIEATPNLDWLLLTKRPDFMAEWFRARVGGFRWPANAWAGTTVEDQKRADERIPHLLRVPARVRFLSMEPLLGPVDLTTVCSVERGAEYEYDALRGRVYHDNGTDMQPRVDWVIVGGESGRSARPTDPVWVRSLRDQCLAAGVAFHFKQWGCWAPLEARPGVGWFTPDGVRRVGIIQEPGERSPMWRLDKHEAGRLLDGRTWDELPRVEA